jgi:hypothetical protein
VVAAGVDFGAVEGLTAGNVEAVVELFDLSAHGAEIGGDERDAVGFLDAEFFGVADADPVLRVRADGGEDGQLVNELRRQRTRDGGAGEALRRSVDLNHAHQLAVFIFEIEDADVGAEGGEDVEQRSASGIEAKRVEDEVGAGEERGRAEEKGRGGNVAGDGGFDGVELLAAGNGNRIEGAFEGRAERTERELAMVARADCFADGGGAVRLEASKEQRGLDLSAGDGRGVVDGGEERAVNRDRRAAFGEFYARAHLRERLADALHGAAAERDVANEGEDAGLRREQAGEHAHGRAGVAAVEGLVRGRELAGCAEDFDCIVFVRDLSAEGTDAGEGGSAVGSGGKIGKARGAVGESAQQCVTVADTFVTGQAKAALDVAGWPDQA